jgi:hypothetical protein
MALLDYVLGRPLASSEDQQERVGPFAGVSVFGLDALSSAAYGPEAALTILVPLGLAGVGFGLPITAAVSAILAIVYFSYRQTIAAYPRGAGLNTSNPQSSRADYPCPKSRFLCRPTGE